MIAQDKKEDTRERILRVAFQLFHEQGYHSAGVSTILREAGLKITGTHGHGDARVVELDGHPFFIGPSKASAIL